MLTSYFKLRSLPSLTKFPVEIKIRALAHCAILRKLIKFCTSERNLIEKPYFVECRGCSSIAFYRSFWSPGWLRICNIKRAHWSKIEPVLFLNKKISACGSILPSWLVAVVSSSVGVGAILKWLIENGAKERWNGQFPYMEVRFQVS